MHIHIVACCGVKGVLFTNKLDVISLIPTCLQSFIHPSILVRELHNMHVYTVHIYRRVRLLSTLLAGKVILL